jgi:hypothetical protein
VTIPLDAWVEESKLEGFIKNIIPTLRMYGVEDGEDLTSCIRYIMVSLRQELEKDWKRRPLLFVPVKDPDKERIILKGHEDKGPLKVTQLGVIGPMAGQFKVEGVQGWFRLSDIVERLSWNSGIEEAYRNQQEKDD